MLRQPPGATRTYTLLPYPTLFRSVGNAERIERFRGLRDRRQHVGAQDLRPVAGHARRRGGEADLVEVEQAEARLFRREAAAVEAVAGGDAGDRKSTRLNSSQ